jgi:hypothetical protein
LLFSVLCCHQTQRSKLENQHICPSSWAIFHHFHPCPPQQWRPGAHQRARALTGQLVLYCVLLCSVLCCHQTVRLKLGNRASVIMGHFHHFHSCPPRQWRPGAHQRAQGDITSFFCSFRIVALLHSVLCFHQTQRFKLENRTSGIIPPNSRD